MTDDRAISRLEQLLSPIFRAALREALGEGEGMRLRLATPPLTPHQLWRRRRARDDVFGHHASLLGEPSWDMLLAIAGTSSTPLSVNGACQMSAGPQTTALRRLNALIDAGLVRRKNDRTDARRAFVSLTSEGHSIMAAALKAAQ